MSKVTKQAPAWHAQAIAEINREFAETNALTESARRRRARLGLMLIWVKEMGKADGSIPHGQFGPWVEGTELPRRTAGDYITEARSVLDLLRWQNGEIRHFELPPHRLLLANPDELKGVEKDRLTRLLDVVDQRKHFRAVTKYAQVELKDDATVPKRGRRKGEGGASREQRALHKKKLAEADLKGIKAAILNLGDLADSLADAKRVGNPEAAAEFDETFPKIENLFRFMQSVNEGRKGN
jgi:hypothetical protein